MLSLVGIVALLVVLLLARTLLRMWDRHIEAALEGHLRGVGEIARRHPPESDMAEGAAPARPAP